MHSPPSQRNFAVFVPANAGKSSLEGYLTLKTKELAAQWPSFLQTLRHELGTEYIPAQKLAYIVDTGKEERRKGTQKQGLGTSKEMHTARLSISLGGSVVPLNVIDTPGAQPAERQRYVGMFLGDVGIFVIECRRLIDRGWGDPDAVREFFAPLIAWREFKLDCTFAVVLSKFDQCDFLEENYDKATQVVEDILGSPRPGALAIIPASIDVAEELDANIMTRSARMPWFAGPTLLEWIEAAAAAPARRAQHGGSQRAWIESSLPRQAEPAGVPRLLRGKVLYGRFAVGDDVQIAPVRHADGSIGAVRAKLRSLKQEKGELASQLHANELGGFGLVPHRGHKGFELCRSSCLFGEADQVIHGFALCVQFESPAAELEVNEKITLIWFGKLLEFTVLGPRNGRAGEVVLESAGEPVALSRPFDVDAHERFFFRRRRAESIDFLRSRVVDIGQPALVRLNGVSESGQAAALLRKAGFKPGRSPDELTLACEAGTGHRAAEMAAEYARAAGLSRRIAAGHLAVEFEPTA